jgi:hypothetical protein
MGYLSVQKHLWDMVCAFFLFIWEISKSLFDYIEFASLVDASVGCSTVYAG